MADASVKTVIPVVIGVDEAGRGCAWGSVFAGATILPPELLDEKYLSKEEAFLLRDSKKLSEKRREQAAEMIQKQAIAWGVGEATAEEIDRWNILHSTHTAMHRAIRNCIQMLREKEKHMPGIEYEIEEILVDGNRLRLYITPEGDAIEHRCIIGGDACDRSIAAGSILAKTSRDHHVMNAVKENPELDEKWQMGRHKGYCTKEHVEALERWGIHPLHRKSYAPVKKILGLL
jgi:ribonuclease HII